MYLTKSLIQENVYVFSIYRDRTIRPRPRTIRPRYEILESIYYSLVEIL